MRITIIAILIAGCLTSEVNAERVLTVQSIDSQGVAVFAIDHGGKPYENCECVGKGFHRFEIIDARKIRILDVPKDADLSEVSKIKIGRTKQRSGRKMFLTAQEESERDDSLKRFEAEQQAGKFSGAIKKAGSDYIVDLAEAKKILLAEVKDLVIAPKGAIDRAIKEDRQAEFRRLRILTGKIRSDIGKARSVEELKAIDLSGLK